MLAARYVFLTTIAAGALGAAVSGCDVRENDPYEPIPPHFDFPVANPDQLKHYVDTDDVHNMRRHAWMVFAGLTHRSRRRPELPIWETWYDKVDVFSGPSETVVHAEPLRLLAPPVELRPNLVPDSPLSPGNLAAIILYNRETCEAIRKNKLYLKETLDDLQTKPPRDVAKLQYPFPSTSVALKTSWMLIHKDKVCSSIPVWDFERLVPASLSNILDNWPHQIWIRPAAGLCPEQPNAYSLDWAKRHFYWFQVPSDPQRLAEIQNSVKGTQPFDYVVLVGFHFATKELADWVWATFWWHDQPDLGIYADDRPRPAKLKGVWRNYLMNVAYDMDKPREPDARPHIAYNPYLEGFLIGGLVSNCMTCHRRATWPLAANVQTADRWASGSRPFDQLVVRGSDAATASYFDNLDFDNRLKLGFLWSLARLGKR